MARESHDRGIERSELHGCRPDAIERVRVVQRVDALPSVYVEFLTVMGRGAGAFLPGTDVFYPHPIELKTEARALLSENGVADFLGDSEVVVSMHQGYQFAWMTVGDPRVRLYSEEYEGVRHGWSDLPAFLLATG